jgi:pyruvate dehydrogenase E1 component beta subunit
MTELTYRDAINAALYDELDSDPAVFLLGEDIAAAGGVFKVTEGLFERFGPLRVRDTPISEQAIVGAALGAAVTGMRPVAEIMFADFAGVCFDQIANQMPKYRYMTGGQVSVPVTLRLVNGASGGFGAQHSQAVENWFLGIPGLKVCTPSTPADCYGLLRSAIRDDNPVLFFEHKGLYALTGEVDRAATVPLGRADVVRAGDAATVVATQAMRILAQTAANELAGQGIEVELIDPRSLAPFDFDTVSQSLTKTNYLVVIEEGPGRASWATTLITRMVQDHFELLDGPPALISTDDIPIPYAAVLESAWLPSVSEIVTAVRQLVLS